MKHHPINRTLVKIIVLIAIPLGALMMHVQRAQADSFTWSPFLNSGTDVWISLAVSPGGTYIAGVTHDEPGEIFLSTDGGADWTQTTGPAGSHAWTSIAESSNGRDLTVTEMSGYVWSSIDGGTNWTQGTGLPSANWESATMSANGGYAAAIDADNNTMWTEQGNTSVWTEAHPNFAPYYSIAYSPDGEALIAGSAGGYVAVSTNQGTSWSFENTGFEGTSFTTVTAGDGGFLAAAGSSASDIITSANNGSTWTDTGYGSGTTWGHISESSSGQVIAAIPTGAGYISLSTDGGSTWETETTPGQDGWGGLDVASDASEILAGGTGLLEKGIPPALVIPNVPTNAAAATASGYLNTTITWDAPSGGGAPANYFVEVIKHGDTDWTDDEIVKNEISANDPLTDTIQLPAYGQYDIRVSAANVTGTVGYATTTYSTSAPVVQDISSCAELQAIDADPTSGYADTYDVTQDFSCSDIPNFESLGWTQSGLGLPSTGAFSGIFNGQGHTISDISIVDSGLPDFGVGLFDDASGATIENLTISGSVTGGVRLGGLVGLGSNLDIENITSSMVVNDSTATGVGGLVGGLLADNGTSTISNNTVSGDVNGTSSGNVGGLVGSMEVSDISGAFTLGNNTVSGNVIGEDNDVGGLVGEANLDTEIDGENVSLVADHDTTTGTVSDTAGDQTGGLFGDIEGYTDSASSASVSITNSSASGDVSSAGGSFDGTGGLVGLASIETDGSGPATLTMSGDSYTTGTVTGVGEGVIGGLVGWLQAIENGGTGLTSYTLNQDYSTGNVEGEVALGDLIGFISDKDTSAAQPLVSGTISQSYTTGSITEENGGEGGGYEGGLLGFYANFMDDGDTSDSELSVDDTYATGSVEGSGEDGGLLGLMTMPITVDRSYATGSVTGLNTPNNGGGLIGVVEGDSVLDSFSTGAVSGFALNNGGLIGSAGELNLANLWYDQVASTQSSCISGGTDGEDGCSAVNTTDVPDANYFFNSTTNPPFSGGTTNWDFNSVWNEHTDTYPTLRAFVSEPVISSVSASPSQTSAQITWTTDETASSSVEYGTTNNFGSNATGTSGSTAHSVSLSNLVCDTVYDYQVTSVDVDSNSNSSSHGTLTTLPCAVAQPSVVTSASISSGQAYACMDPKATNYDTYPSPDNTACEYAATSSTLSVATTPEPSSVPVAASFIKNLKKGSVGLDVQRLQEYLGSHGFVVMPKGKETTTFGPKTKAELALFQKSAGLAPDGSFGPKTRAYVNRHLQ